MGGCCSSEPEYRDDSDDDVLTWAIPRDRDRHPAPVIVPPTRPRVAPQPLSPSALRFQTVTTTTCTTTATHPVPIGHRVRPATTSVKVVNHQVGVAPHRTGTGRIARGNCESCGQSDHVMADCRYRNRLCFYCREEGHIISVCQKRKRKQQQQNRGGGRGRGTVRRGRGRQPR